MYKCKKCGYEFEGKFCPECGTKRQDTVICPACGKQYAEGVKFCTDCGSALHSANVLKTGGQPTVKTDIKTEKTEYAVSPEQDKINENSDDFFGFDCEQVQTADKSTVENTAQLDTDKKLSFMFWFLSKHRNILLWLSFGGLSFCLTAVMLLLHNERSVTSNTPAFIIAALVFGIIFLALTVFTVVKLISKSRIPNYPDMLKWRKQNKSYISYVGIYLLIVVCVAVITRTTDVFKGNFAAVLAACVLCSVLYVAELICYSVCFKKIENKFIIKNVDGTVVSGLTPYVLKSIQDMRGSLTEYACAGNARREAVGKLPKTEHEYEKQILIKRTVGALAAFILAAGIFVLAVCIPKNIYKTGTIERISVGDDIGYVTRMLGDYFDYKEYKDENDKVIGGTFYYCSDSLAKKIAQKNARLKTLEESDSFEDFDKILTLSAEIEELESKLAEKRSNFITVTYEERTVTSIDFEKDCFYGDTVTRAVDKITYSCRLSRGDGVFYNPMSNRYYDYDDTITVYENNQINSVYARLYFTDGSIVNKALQMEIDTSVAGAQTLQWKDDYGNHDLRIVIKR